MENLFALQHRSASGQQKLQIIVKKLGKILKIQIVFRTFAKEINIYKYVPVRH